MSYDVYLEVDSGGPEPVEVFWVNHTSNTSGMWDRAGARLRDWDGVRADECINALYDAIAAISSDPEAWRELEAPNGWGTVETTLRFLRDLREGCRAHPRAHIRVSR